MRIKIHAKDTCEKNTYLRTGDLRTNAPARGLACGPSLSGYRSLLSCVAVVGGCGAGELGCRFGIVVLNL
jgi:hypothetical protein